MSGCKGVISAPQEAPAVMLGALGAAVVAAGVAGGSGDALFMTMMALLAVVGVVTGLCFVVVAHFRIAGVFRFIPYTILAGFLSATGWVVCVAGLSAMTGIVPAWGTLLQFIEPVMLWKWGPGGRPHMSRISPDRADMRYRPRRPQPTGPMPSPRTGQCLMLAAAPGWWPKRCRAM